MRGLRAVWNVTRLWSCRLLPVWQHPRDGREVLLVNDVQVGRAARGARAARRRRFGDPRLAAGLHAVAASEHLRARGHQERPAPPQHGRAEQPGNGEQRREHRHAPHGGRRRERAPRSGAACVLRRPRLRGVRVMQPMQFGLRKVRQRVRRCRVPRLR